MPKEQVLLEIIKLDLAIRKAIERIFLYIDRSCNSKGNWKDLFIHRQVLEKLTKVYSEANCPWHFDFYECFEKKKIYICLKRQTSNYINRYINHKAPKFSYKKHIFKKEIGVAPNSAEGFFGHLKLYFLILGIKKNAKIYLYT